MDRKSKVASNLWKISAVAGIKCFMLIIAVIVPFFQENGLSMKEILILQSLFAAAAISFEIPSGCFADIFGRRISIIIGSCVGAVGYVVYSLSFGFWGFLAAELILGVGHSFISGSDSALITDSLLELEKLEDYQKVYGKYICFCRVSEGVACVLGGFLALISLRFPLYCETVFTLFALPFAFSITEPNRHTLEAKGNGLRSLLRLVKHSLHDDVEIKWLILYSAISNASTMTMFWFIQPYLAANGIPVAYNGVILSGLIIFSAIVSFKAHRIEKTVGKKTSFALILFLPVGGFVLLSCVWFSWSFLLLGFFYAARGLNEPITSDYVNALISSEIRSTVLSVKNFMSRLIFSVVGPLIGWICDAYSLKTALLFCGGIFFAAGLLALFFLRKHKVW